MPMLPPDPPCRKIIVSRSASRVSLDTEMGPHVRFAAWHIVESVDLRNREDAFVEWLGSWICHGDLSGLLNPDLKEVVVIE